MKRILHKFKLTEISAVDRPAQAHAKSVIMKRADDDDAPDWFAKDAQFSLEDADALEYFAKRFFSASARRKDAKSGAAMSDGSFPIENESDLRNAERLAGHAKDPSAARAHIRSRAKALGLSSHMEKTMADETVKNEEAAELKKQLDAANAKIAEFEKKDSKAENERGDTEGEKSDKDGTEANPDKQEATPRKMKKALEDAEKSAEDLRKRNEDMAKRLAVLEDEREQVAFAKRAVSLGLPEAQGEIIRKVYKGDAKAIGEFEAIIKGLTAQVETGALFKEFGTSRGADATSADAMLKVKAEEYKSGQTKIGKKCSDAQAFTAVYTDPANSELKKRYDDETAVAKRRVA